ncbi:hypothetical protein GEV33_001484 [Tenebrio molitor]|uniref:Uncharacterized protein n=1 Tax=Tenebrio molitor TaxID=7067 RepID=A0A8J6HW00_TENMO|nr:hypothetical protein GEV33_001484 [Tenebrio molitor]
MVVESSTTDDNTTTNKGVNVHSESLPVRVHRYVDTETSSSTNAASRSLADIRNEIQNVLDLMGPSTPNISCAYNMSSDADNETSVMSVVDVMGRQKRKSGSSSQRGRSIPTTVEISSSSERQSTYVPQPNSPTKDSLVADVGTLSTPDNFDTFEDTGHSCCDHCHFSTAPECLCMVRYVNQTSVPVVPSRTCDVEGIPKPTCSTVATNTIRNPIEKYKTTKDSSLRKGPDWSCTCKGKKNLTNESITQEQNNIQKNIYFDSDGNARVDYYYFDHGNAQYFHTTDTPPVMKCEILAEKTERYTTRFWAEFFASIHIGVAFLTILILILASSSQRYIPGLRPRSLRRRRPPSSACEPTTHFHTLLMSPSYLGTGITSQPFIKQTYDLCIWLPAPAIPTGCARSRPSHVISQRCPTRT